MGRISAPFGVRGWVKVQPNTAAAQNLLAYKTWWVEDGGEWRDRSVAQAKVHGRTVVAKLDGCEDRDAAIALRGKLVAVPRAELPGTQSGEYYWADLMGLAVVNESAQALAILRNAFISRLRCETATSDTPVCARGRRRRRSPAACA